MVTTFVLEVKPFGAKGFKECYKGNNTSFIASGLKARTIHVFRVAAINRCGQGGFSPNAAFRTLTAGAEGASSLLSGWVSALDEKSQRYFYHPPTQQSAWDLPEVSAAPLYLSSYFLS